MARTNEITIGASGIKIDGHTGTWYVIDSTVRNGVLLFLLEHELHGDDAASLIVDNQGSIKLDDVWNGFDDLDEI